MRSKGSRQGTLRRYIAAPKRFLAKARDLYVKNMTELDNRVFYGSSMVMPCPAPPVPGHIPRDFGSSLKKGENDEKRKEFYRSVYKKQVENYGGGKGRNDGHGIMGGGYDGLGRSYSVGVGRIGRIDEGEPCFFREEEIIMKSEILFPTCRR